MSFSPEKGESSSVVTPIRIRIRRTVAALAVPAHGGKN